ncbi:hypothetical protein D9M68_906960 [compost metagenome]
MVFHYIKFTTHNRFYPVFSGGSHKVKHPEHVSVIGDGHSGHFVFLGLGKEFFDAGGTVKKGILGMIMEVGKFHVILIDSE